MGKYLNEKRTKLAQNSLAQLLYYGMRMKKIEEIHQTVIRTKRQVSEEKYRHLIENMKLGLLEVDNDEKIIFANSSFCAMVGYDYDELLGKKASDLLLDPGDVAVMSQKNEDRTKGVSSVYEMPIRTKDGQITWMLISGGALYNHKEEVIDIGELRSINN